MKQKRLGDTSLSVSVIGYGTWGLGGTSYGPMNEKKAIELLSMALDRGVTFYDTADLYGNGYCEDLIGRALNTQRDSVVYATKGGTLPHTGFHMPQDFSRKYLSQALEESLRRLQTDYVDLYQLHSPTMEDVDQHDCVETLQRFKRDGKIREYGISVRSPIDGKTAIQTYGFKIIQVNYNLLDHRATECQLFDTAVAHHAGIICRTPMCFGFLSGKLKPGATFVKGDHRANWPKAQLDRWANAPLLFDDITKRNGQSYAQLSLQFCLAQEAISTVIPGMMNQSELEEDLAAAEFPPLTVTTLNKIKQIYNDNIFFDKTAKSKGTQ